jgi:putative ABC transport system substrate-binding protein
MKRRQFITVFGGTAMALFLPTRAGAQGGHAGSFAHVIGLLSPFSRADTEPWHRAFREGLRSFGWVEGTNVRLEYRFADGRQELLPGLVAELIALKVDVMVVTVTTDAIPAAMATKTIPIVMASTGDPVGTGLIASLARPGGNITGLTQVATDLAAKRLELLAEVAPGHSRVAVLWDPQDPVAQRSWQEVQLPAQQLGIKLHSLEVRSGDLFDPLFARAISANDDAVMVMPAAEVVVHRRQIAEFALANHLPSIFFLPEFVRSGGLISYGPNRSDLFRRRRLR